MDNWCEREGVRAQFVIIFYSSLWVDASENGGGTTMTTDNDNDNSKHLSLISGYCCCCWWWWWWLLLALICLCIDLLFVNRLRFVGFVFIFVIVSHLSHHCPHPSCGCCHSIVCCCCCPPPEIHKASNLLVWPHKQNPKMTISPNQYDRNFTYSTFYIYSNEIGD